MARAKKGTALTPEERLQAALVPDWEWPYKLPENWCWTRHNSIMDIVGGAQPEKAFFIREPKEGYVQLYQTRDYGENPVPVYIPQKYATKTTDEGDILLARYGGSLGKVFRAHKGAYNVALAKVIILYPEVVDDEFLYLYYYSHFYQDFCIKAGYGRSAQAGFNKSDLNELLFPLPPFIEQRRIVDRIESLFAKLDEAKEKAQAVVDSFETRKAAILHKAFTGELTKKWRKSANTRWVYKKIKDCCKLGSGGTPSRKVPDFYKGDIPWIKTGEIEWNDIYDTEEKITQSAIDNSSARCYKPGVVLVAMYGMGVTRGKASILRVQAATNQAVCVLEPQSALLYNRYLLYYFMRNYWDIREKAVGGNQLNLSLTIIKELNIEIPPIDEQVEIVQILDDLFAKEQQTKEAAEAALDQIDLMKKSILARAFRGELGTNDPSEESAVELLKQII